MEKNEFELDEEFDFEKEYGFAPEDFMSSDDDFDFGDFLNGDSELHMEGLSDFESVTKQQVPEQPEEANQDQGDEDLVADFPEHTAQNEASPENSFEESGFEEAVEADAEESEESEDISDEASSISGKKEKKRLNIALPKMPVMKKPNIIGKKGTVSKLLELYLEPLTKYNSEEDVLDPTDPHYIMRRKREKKRIYKDVYLPAIISGVSLLLILSFIVGSVSNAIAVKKQKDSLAKLEAQVQANAAGAAELEFKRLIAAAENLAVGYNYEEAIHMLESYSGGNDKFQQQINAKRAELINEQGKLVEIKDTSSIPNLSFHVLMADAARACSKDVSGAELAGLYNKNFVSVEEFSRILNQLYSANYVLVDFDSFVSTSSGVDGNESLFTTSLYMPQGKKPVMITETMVNYFEYMVDPDKDGTPDAKGHGFANKLVVDANGDIKASYVDSQGQNLIGNYDLVPVLEAFIQEHPDFSYRGARAILAVTGTEGVFGYRTNTSYVSSRGQAYYDGQVAEARKLVAALRSKGYTIASYTYSNQAYRTMTTLQIQTEIQNWANQITPVVGDVNTIVFARSSDIDAYSGTTFNVLYKSGLRFFVNSGSSPRLDANTTFIRQTRLMVTGEAMAHYPSQFSDYFDCNIVLDMSSRGSTPAKS